MVAVDDCPGRILPWPGSKSRLAPWIISHLPPSRVYVEPFLGSAAVFLVKPVSTCEILNDLSGDICALFRTLREQPEALIRAVELTPWAREEWQDCQASDAPDEVERVRRFLVRSWQSLGYTSGGWRVTRRANAAAASVWIGLPERLAWATRRLKEAHIDCIPALELLAKVRATDTAIFADPPYPLSVRGESHTSRAYYPHEMTDADHIALLAALDHHPGPVLLSGYRCELYDSRLTHWIRLERQERALTGEARVECLWLNPTAAQAGQGRLLFEEGDNG